MVDTEWNRRQQNKLICCVREAHFAAPSAMIEDIEYHEVRRLDKAQIPRFASYSYIEEGLHIILKGALAAARLWLNLRASVAHCPEFTLLEVYYQALRNLVKYNLPNRT